MRLPALAPVLTCALALVATPLRARVGPQNAPPAVPADAVSAIIEAFASHPVVALSDAHGNEQAQAFLIRLVRDPRFATTVDDIVVEFGSARHQATMDRFVRGEDISYEQLRQAWQDTTQVSAAADVPINEMFFRAVRDLNATLPPERRLRVLLGDPPIDWDQIRTPADHRRWVEMREWHPASLIGLEVIAKQRRALLVYGHGHFQRQNILSNYDMRPWQAQTIVSLLERAGIRVFTVWRDADLADIQPDVVNWPTPSVAAVRGTVLGAADFERYFSPGNRLALEDGRLVPVAREDWRMLPAEEQFDAVLYLGPPSSLTYSLWSRELCEDQPYRQMRAARMERAGVSPEEADVLNRHCATLLGR